MRLYPMANRLEGIIPAVWTPTDGTGRLLTSELRSNLDFLKRHGVHGFMALGSTGEFPLLDVETRKLALGEIIAAAGSVPVVANVSDIRPSVMVELAKFSKQA